MNKKIVYFSIISFLFILYSGKNTCNASELVYTPINPSFGGSSFNGAWLLSQAQAQNTLTEKKAASSSYSRDPLEDFQKSLNRSILSRLSRQLVTSAFGEDSLQEGSYEIGDFVIDVTEGDDGVNIRIIDGATGNETSIVVPYY